MVDTLITAKFRTPNPFAEWKKSFLRKRNYEWPTGIPLYSYRVSNEEFIELECLLKERLSQYLKLYSLGDLAKLVPYFPPLFVLYAAEWWRRRYDGSGWSWEPIVEGLGASPVGWTQAQRSECVERGLGEWRLGLRYTHGLRFLGSIAFNGGLPMQLLATARGNIGRVLSRVLRLAGTGSVDAADIQGWVASLSTDLPNAYRQTEIYVLLTEIILTVLRLKESAKLTTATGALAELDRLDPHWRNYFPFPVEDEQAQGLLDQLIRDAAGVRAARTGTRIAVERRLERVEEGTWHLRAEVDMPEYISAKDLATLISAEVTALPRLMNMHVLRATGIVELPVRRLAGQERYRIERRPLDSRHEDAASEHSLVLSAADGASWYAGVAKGETLDESLPWIFEAPDANSQSLRFVRQGSGAVSGRECWVCLPARWPAHGDEGGECRPLGAMLKLERSVIHVHGVADFEDEAGQRYRIRSGQAAALEEHLEWRGNRIWEVFLSPSLGFRGGPKLYRVSDDGLAQPASGQIAWRIPGARPTLTPTGLSGPLEATWPAGGDVIWRSRLVVLPSDSSEILDPGKSPFEGCICLANWGASTVRARTEGVECEEVRDGRSVGVDLKWRGGGNPPEWVDLDVLWPGNPSPAVVRFPYPALGARAFDPTGLQLPSGTLLSVDKLPGVRLVAFLSTTRRAQLELKVGNSAGISGRVVVSRDIRATERTSRAEVRLIDYSAEIQRMLASSDALDAAVTVTLRAAGGAAASLRVSRYAAGMQRDNAYGTVMLEAAAARRLSPVELERTQVRALRLDEPGDEPLSFPQARSEGVPTGCWQLNRNQLSAGPWLVYPAPTSEVKFRPLRWSVEGIGDGSGALAHAMRLCDQSERFAAFDEVVETLCSDFTHADWLAIERLAGHLGHLPLSALDLWRRLARSPRGMAALAFRVSSLPSGLVGRFAAELPFLWELVPFQVWREAISSAGRQCAEWYGEGVGATMFGSHVDRRIQELASSDHSLRALLESARASATGTVTREIQIAQQPMMEEVFAAQLFDGESCRLQQLLRNNAESQWPEGFAAEVSAARKSAVAGKYLSPTEHSFHDSVIHIPILLAIQAVTGEGFDWNGRADAISLLRTHQSFDPDWFAEAFDLTVARCLATGLLAI